MNDTEEHYDDRNDPKWESFRKNAWPENDGWVEHRERDSVPNNHLKRKLMTMVGKPWDVASKEMNKTFKFKIDPRHYNSVNDWLRQHVHLNCFLDENGDVCEMEHYGWGRVHKVDDPFSVPYYRPKFYVHPATGTLEVVNNAGYKKFRRKTRIERNEKEAKVIGELNILCKINKIWYNLHFNDLEHRIAKLIGVTTDDMYVDREASGRYNDYTGSYIGYYSSAIFKKYETYNKEARWKRRIIGQKCFNYNGDLFFPRMVKRQLSRDELKKYNIKNEISIYHKR